MSQSSEHGISFGGKYIRRLCGRDRLDKVGDNLGNKKAQPGDVTSASWANKKEKY